MLGSEGHSFGSWKSGFRSYDLGLGTINAGIHNIKLKVDDRGIGNGKHRLDAIILLVK
jgi:hypothetical protein